MDSGFDGAAPHFSTDGFFNRRRCDRGIFKKEPGLTLLESHGTLWLVHRPELWEAGCYR
jgi:hypothetical protein